MSRKYFTQNKGDHMITPEDQKTVDFQEEEFLFKLNKDEILFIRELMKYHRAKKTKYLKNWWGKGKV
jgi:hypothetical protein